MSELIAYLLTGIIFIGFLYIFWKVIKKVAINSVVGLFLLFIFKFAFHIAIPLNIWTILVTGFFGLGGVGSLMILHAGGII